MNRDVSLSIWLRVQEDSFAIDWLRRWVRLDLQPRPSISIFEDEEETVHLDTHAVSDLSLVEEDEEAFVFFFPEQHFALWCCDAIEFDEVRLFLVRMYDVAAATKAPLQVDQATETTVTDASTTALASAAPLTTATGSTSAPTTTTTTILSTAEASTQTMATSTASAEPIGKTVAVNRARFELYVAHSRRTRSRWVHHLAAQEVAKTALLLKRAAAVTRCVKGCESLSDELNQQWPLVEELSALPRLFLEEEKLLRDLQKKGA